MEKIESDYIRSTSIEHRKQLGQFYTPELIADFMLNWIFEGDPKIIYDPAFGLGKFFNVASRKKFHGIFFGTEIDPTTYNYFKKHNQNSIDNIINEDYFSRWSPNYYDSIICNPPYLRFQKFVNRKDVLNSIYRHTDIKLSGYTNISSAFLVKSIFELKNDGRLAYIMPLEFLNTGYGKK